MFFVLYLLLVSSVFTQHVQVLWQKELPPFTVGGSLAAIDGTTYVILPGLNCTHTAYTTNGTLVRTFKQPVTPCRNDNSVTLHNGTSMGKAAFLVTYTTHLSKNEGYLSGYSLISSEPVWQHKFNLTTNVVSLADRKPTLDTQMSTRYVRFFRGGVYPHDAITHTYTVDMFTGTVHFINSRPWQTAYAFEAGDNWITYKTVANEKLQLLAYSPTGKLVWNTTFPNFAAPYLTYIAANQDLSRFVFPNNQAGGGITLGVQTGYPHKYRFINLTEIKGGKWLSATPGIGTFAYVDFVPIKHHNHFVVQTMNIADAATQPWVPDWEISINMTKKESHFAYPVYYQFGKDGRYTLYSGFQGDLGFVDLVAKQYVTAAWPAQLLKAYDTMNDVSWLERTPRTFYFLWAQDEGRNVSLAQAVF